MSGVLPSYFLKEIGPKTEEKEKEDTSGREIHHGEYFEHLDILIQLVDQEQKEETEGRKKSVTEQQSAKERVKETHVRPGVGTKGQRYSLNLDCI